MNVPGGSTSVKIVLQPDTRTKSAQQTFDFLPVSGRAQTYRIRNGASGLCASDYRNAVRQSSCAGDPSAPLYGKWTLSAVDSAHHTYRIEVTQTLGSTPYCMTFTGVRGDVDLSACTGSDRQVAKAEAFV